MKKQIKYRPKGLTKAEKEYLKAQERRGAILTLIVVIAGLLILYAIFKMMEDAVGL